MSDALTQYLAYLAEIWRRRWLVLVIAIIVCAIGWPVVLFLPDKYEVSAKINVDTQTALKPLLQGLAVDSDFTQQTAMMIQRTLLTRPNLEKVVRTADLDLKAHSPAELDRIILGLSKKIEIDATTTNRRLRPDQQTQTLYSISYTDTDAKRAKTVVDEILALFVENVLSATRKDSDMTQEFLTKEIKEYERKLEASENRLKEFKRENVGLMPDADSNYFTQLSRETAQLDAAKLELDEAIKRQNELTREINEVTDSLKRAGEAQQDVVLSPLDERIQNMESRLDELLLQYTEEHPDVVSVRRILEELKKQKKNETVEQPQDAQDTRLLNNNPVYQELKVALGEAKAQVAALRARVNLYQQNVARLKTLIDTMPRVEAELAKLNRDYNVIHERYLELVKRRESARISFEAGANPEDTPFKVVEPPRVPLDPIWPNRPLFLTGVLAAGIGAGIGLILLLLQLKPTYSDWNALKKDTGIPVLGAVSLVLSSKQISRERVSVAMFSFIVVVLLASYFGLVAAQLFNLNLENVRTLLQR
jgi:polysaccharide chain length determinant protein (PEP-CTERM system associated)